MYHLHIEFFVAPRKDEESSVSEQTWTSERYIIDEKKLKRKPPFE
jgi:hypothetical protein